MFWKRFVESATVWLHKYRNDPFFRTEVNVVGLQAVFALVIIGLIGVSFSLLYHNISLAIVEGIRASLASDAGASMGPAIVAEIEHIRSENLWTIVAIITGVTVVFGYIIARVTLRPARSALASQKQFIGNVAHELRTPLSVIKTNTEVALLDTGVDKDMREMLLSNVEELDRISQIINNLLSLSALVRPEGMEFKSIDFSALVTRVVDKYSALAKSNELDVTVRKAPDLKVWGNATALEQIVGNILKNAINYTPKGGRVRVTLELALNNHVELVIQDSGVGIARKDLFRIFEPFYRAEPSRVRMQDLSRKNSGGTGLGLTIVSELIKAHEGRITMRSTIGHGTTVTVLLPSPRGHEVTGTSAQANPPSEIAMDFSKNVA
jgi:signal transduction histidine kinase